ncbi:MAG: N-6 DNA methylase, partial [Acidobacteriota bacterium]
LIMTSNAKSERKRLRGKGQFWTPDWVAEAMAAYLLIDGATEVFDPAVGAGALLRAAKTVGQKFQRAVALLGTEIDPEAIQQAIDSGLSPDDLADVQIRDFALNPPQRRFKAIIANPPYIRHHRLSASAKEYLKAFATKLIGRHLDGRAGLHVYFLIRALDLLEDDGRLAFILPADICEGVFARSLWMWITQNFCLDAVITFSSEASPFPSIDTNPLIILIRKAKPTDEFFWVRCNECGGDQLKEWVSGGMKRRAGKTLSLFQRNIEEGLATGLSRPPSQKESDGPRLVDFARVMRGIATGANDFFFLTKKQASEFDIPDEFLVPAIGRTRDLEGDEITLETLRELELRGRPTLLFAPDGRPVKSFPQSVQNYLLRGEEAGLHQKPLIATRRPWYKMERRAAPPFLFAYLGRRSARFIRNTARVIPLTGFLCVYPHRDDDEAIEKLWQVLLSPEIIFNLSLVGKSYGDGAIKVEPRALEKLLLPSAVESGLKPEAKAAQLSFGYRL